MSQTSYSIDMEIAQVGLKADTGFDNVLSYRAQEEMGFGLGLVQGAADSDALLPSQNVGVLSFDADFVSDNDISLDVNGETVGPVSFDTDQATTLEALKDAINALDKITAGVTDTREITITSREGALTVENISVTGGGSQANGSISYSAAADFIGVSAATHAIEQNKNNVAKKAATETVSVLTRGRIYVYTEQDVTVQDSVYLRSVAGGSDEKRGQFRKDDDGGNAFLVSGARFLKDASAGGITIVEVNLPN